MYDSPYTIFWTAYSLATQLGLVVLHHKPEFLVKKQTNLNYCIQGQGQSMMHHHESECHAKRFVLVFSRSQQELIWSKYDIFYYIFWTADPFATKLGLIVLHLKPECLMMKLDCCVQDHSKISKCQWMFVQMISAEMLNLFLPGLVWWCSIMSQIVFQKDWFAVFKITITDMIKLWLFNILSELLILLQLNLVWWHIIIKWRLDCSVVAWQWGTADAEIKVPSGENIELKRSPFKAWSRSVYSHACYYCQGFLPCLFLPLWSVHLHFFPKSPNFSCVGCG